MRKAEIIDGIVVNAIEIDPDSVPSWCADWPDLPDGAGIGWRFDGQGFHPPADDGPTPEEARAALPPITRRQLRLTLVRNGVSLDGVAAMIEALPEGLAKDEARIEWDDATTFDRLHPTLVLIGDGMGMTPEQVDALWEEAMGA